MFMSQVWTYVFVLWYVRTEPEGSTRPDSDLESKAIGGGGGVGMLCRFPLEVVAFLLWLNSPFCYAALLLLPVHARCNWMTPAFPMLGTPDIPCHHAVSSLVSLTVEGRVELQTMDLTRKLARCFAFWVEVGSRDIVGAFSYDKIWFYTLLQLGGICFVVEAVLSVFLAWIKGILEMGKPSN